MQNLIQHKPEDESVFDFIEKKRSEGKRRKEAMIARLNKFLRIYYGKLTEIFNSIDEQLFYSKIKLFVLTFYRVTNYVYLPLCFIAHFLHLNCSQFPYLQFLAGLLRLNF